MGSFTVCGKFVGPDAADMSVVSRVVSLGGGDWIAVDPCPFYPESGGQVGDQGLLVLREKGAAPIRVVDCQNHLDLGAVVRVQDGAGSGLCVGDVVTAVVDVERRKATSQHHTATHVVQSALKHLISEDVHQAGSKVSPSSLRFDFVDSSSPGEQRPDLANAVAEFVRAVAAREAPVATLQTTLDKAKTELNATALFGEK